MSALKRRRLDAAVADLGLAPSRSRAQALILAGQVRVNAETVRDSARPVAEADRIEVGGDERWASRGALKLLPVLDAFGVDPAGRVCADLGASTGGFTDVLLRRGAARVYAVDVAYGIIDYRLRAEPRVVLMERTNARHLQPGSFPEPVTLVTVDLSFIGLAKVLPALRAAAPAAELVALFKPQFEVGRQHVGKGGVVRDLAVVAAALDEFAAWAVAAGWRVAGRMEAGLPGPQGNQEHFFHLLPEGAA